MFWLVQDTSEYQASGECWLPVKWSESRSVVSDSLRPHGLYTYGILQARILEWVAFPFSKGPSQTRDQTQVSCIADRFFNIWATRAVQEYWSGEPVPSTSGLPDSGIKPGSPVLQVDSLPAESGKSHWLPVIVLWSWRRLKLEQHINYMPLIQSFYEGNSCLIVSSVWGILFC